MLRSEFDYICEELDVDITSLTDEEYDLIEYIYNWSPLIGDYDGKYEVVKLYELFGIGIFEDMKPRAEHNAKLYNKKHELLKSINDIDKEMVELKRK